MAIDRSGKQAEDGDITREVKSPNSFKRSEKTMTKFGGGKFGTGRFSIKKIIRTKT